MKFKHFMRRKRRSLESSAAEAAEQGMIWHGMLDGRQVFCEPDSVQDYFKEKAERLAKKMAGKEA